MSKGHRVISRKTKNGSDMSNIEPVLRMLSALTNKERAAVKVALDREMFEQRILAASRSKGGLSFSFEEITEMTKLPEKELAHYLNQRVHLSCKGHYE